jgi:hypothetical protein
VVLQPVDKIEATDITIAAYLIIESFFIILLFTLSDFAMGNW